MLGYSTAMFLGYLLTSFAFGAVVRLWTGNWSAALIAASAGGFNQHFVTRMSHLQAMHVEFIAVALFAMDRIFTRQRLCQPVPAEHALDRSRIAEALADVTGGASLQANLALLKANATLAAQIAVSLAG